MATIHFEDKDYAFELEDLDLAQARSIKAQTGMSIRKLIDGVDELDPEALAALYWLMLKQNGTATDIRKLNFKVFEFGKALSDGLAEDNKDEEADPTDAADAA